MLKEYAHFFETYKALKSDEKDKYKVTVNGYKGREDAIAAIEKSIKLYDEKYPK